MKLIEYMTFSTGPSRMSIRDWEIDAACRPVRCRQFGHDTNKLGQMIYMLSSSEFIYDNQSRVVGKRLGRDGCPSYEIRIRPGLDLTKLTGHYAISSVNAEAFPWKIDASVEKTENGCRIKSRRTSVSDGTGEEQDVSIVRLADRLRFRFEGQEEKDAGVWRAIPGMPTVYEKRVSDSLTVSAASSEAFDYGLYDYHTSLLNFIFLV